MPSLDAEINEIIARHYRLAVEIAEIDLALTRIKIEIQTK